MTRTYVAKRLLEHGPLTFEEMHEITGWTSAIVRRALQRLLKRGEVRRLIQAGYRRYLFALS